jgi:AcrR family transcriptional regulator
MLTIVNGVNTSERETPTGVVPTRRERVRAATEAEILATARDLLVTGGEESLTLREVGRRMGMTASALYRYVDGHAALVDRLTASLFDELVEALHTALPHAVQPRPERAGLDEVRADLMTASHGFRRWAVAHPREFGLMFGRGDHDAGDCPLATQAGERFGQVFVGLFAQAFEGPLPPGDEGLLFSPLPPGIAEMFARGWIRLLGLVMVEVSGEYRHTYLTLDPEHVFEREMADCADAITDALRSVRGDSGGD